MQVNLNCIHGGNMDLNKMNFKLAKIKLCLGYANEM